MKMYMKLYLLLSGLVCSGLVDLQAKQEEENMIDPYEQIAQDFKTAQDRFVETGYALKDSAVDQYDRTTDSVAAAGDRFMENIDNSVQNTRDRLYDSAQGFSDSANALYDNAQNQVNAVGDQFTEMGRKSVDAVDNYLDDTVNTIQYKTDEFAQKVNDRVNTSLDKFTKKLNKLSGYIEGETPSEKLISICKRPVFEGGKSLKEFDKAVGFLERKVQEFIDSGADVTMQDADGNTAYMYLSKQCDAFDENMNKMPDLIDSSTGLMQLGWKQNYDWAQQCSARLRTILEMLNQ